MSFELSIDQSIENYLFEYRLKHVGFDTRYNIKINFYDLREKKNVKNPPLFKDAIDVGSHSFDRLWHPRQS
jgi:hypothetical protein